MRLLDFVEQDHRIRRAPHALGQLPALFVTHVSRRRADQFRYGMLFHVFGHVETNQRFFAAKQELAQPARHFGFAHAGRTQEQEAANRTARSFQAGATAPNSPRQRCNRLFLADDSTMQFLFDSQQLLLLVFLD